ncbi:MAG: FAD:protein FMN transferase [Povalibacter sp.]
MIILVAGCARRPDVIELSGPTMGTTYSVKIARPPRDLDAAKARIVIDDALALIDKQMSTYRADSEISSFNASRSTEWKNVSPDLARLVSASLIVSAESDGVMDITVAPLVNLWGMGPEGEREDLPTAAQISAARARVGYRHLSARNSPPSLRKTMPDLTIDLNAVAPGYAVDLLASRFMNMGVQNFMIDIGGEVAARGKNVEGSLWRIAVEKPVDGEPEPYAIVQLKDIAVTTSGEYRHYVIRKGHRYSHTIDPRTGRPVEHTLASVIVIAPTAFEADAWATALNVFGEEAGYSFALQRQMAAMFIVDVSGRLEPRMTPQFDQYLASPPPKSEAE